MFTKLHPFRIVSALLAALLLVAGLQGAASAATKRGISAAASPAVAATGTTMTFSGRVTASPRGSAVQIQRKSGKKWVRVAATRTVNTAGNYAVRITRPSALGTYAYRAYAPKTKKLRAAGSRVVTVLALRRVLSSLSATPASTTAGTAISLTGSIFPYVKGTVVTLQRKVGNSWVNVSTTPVSSNGTFARGVIPSTSTIYRASVPRAGSNAPGVSNERPVSARPLITSLALPEGSQSGVYPGAQLTTYGNQVGTWSATGMPAGLNLAPSTGRITGTPTGAVQDYNVTIGFRQLSTGLTAAPKTFTLRINKAVDVPVITTTSLPDGSIGVAYSGQLNATLKGQPTSTGTWSATGLPTWASLNPTTGLITGTPDAPGDSQVVVNFTSGGQAAQPKTLTISVDPDPTVPVITSSQLPDATRLAPYNAQVTASIPGGTWTASGLPTGLSISASGAITGTPTDTNQVGDNPVTFNYTVNGKNATAKTLTLHVNQAAAPVITTTNLPDGFKFAPYATTLTASPATAGTWTATGLPATLSLDATTGKITGTPQVEGDYSVVITFMAANTGLTSAPKTLTLHIGAAQPPVIATSLLPNAQRFHAYSTQLVATGNPVGTWTASPLPAGLSLDPATGVISGTPTVAGTTNVVIGFKQTNSGLSATPRTIALTVTQSAPVITTTSLPNGTVGQNYSFQMTLVGAPVGKWSASGLPLGYSLNTSGKLAGNTLFPTTTNVTITFTETSTGLSSTVILPLKVTLSGN